MAHNLLSITHYSVQRLAFDENGGSIWSPLRTYFDVQDLDTERRFSLTEKGQLIDNSVMKSPISRFASTGQFANANGFTVLKRLVRVSGGKHEIRQEL